MTTYDDDNVNYDEVPPEETSNRTFLLAAGGLGLLVLLALLCLGGYFIFSRGTQQQAEQTAMVQGTQQQATIQAGVSQTAVSNALTQTAQPTNTLPPTSTPVIAQATATASPTSNPATATVGAAFTQIAASTQTVVVTSTALPATGVADQFGGPGLAVIAIALIAVIFLVRRLRAAQTR